MDPNISEILYRLLFTLPYIAVWIAGIALCMQYRKHSQNETLFLIIGFGMLIAHTLIANIVQSLLISGYDGSALSLATMFSIMQGVSIVINLIAWALILTGIYQLLQQKHASKENK